jgi:MFS family permease
MLAIQAVITMASYVVPVLAPAAAPDLGVDGSSAGFYTSLVYLMATFSSLLAPTVVKRLGPLRVSQAALLIVGAALALGASNVIALLVLSAIMLGIGYGPPSPASTHVLARFTPPRHNNLVFSIKQIGVPLGGALAGLIVPALVLGFGWQTAILIMAAAPIALIAIVQPLRRQYDDDREPATRLFRGGMFAPLRLVLLQKELTWLALFGLIGAATQLCFGSIMVVYLVERLDYSLVIAGSALATFQITGAISRPIMGWIADRFIAPNLLLGGLGLLLAVMATVFTFLDPTWPGLAVFFACFLVGIGASSWTGLIVAEMTRICGPRDAGVAAGGLFFMMFSGIIIGPSGFAFAVSATGGYLAPFLGLTAIMAAVSLPVLALRRPRRNAPGRAP